MSMGDLSIAGGLVWAEAVTIPAQKSKVIILFFIPVSLILNRKNNSLEVEIIYTKVRAANQNPLGGSRKQNKKWLKLFAFQLLQPARGIGSEIGEELVVQFV